MISVSITLQKLPLYSSNQNFFYYIYNYLHFFMHDFLRKYLIAFNAFLVIDSVHFSIIKYCNCDKGDILFVHRTCGGMAV